jgi:hypothetical protein
MSNGYGIDFYGVAYYGYSQPADYSVAPFNAYQTDYGKITLTWSSPNKTTWKYLQLVRSPYGYPSTPADGISVITISPTNMSRSYDDVGLSQGNLYYYTMFITLETQAWNNTSTYPPNAGVLYNNQYWSSIQAVPANNAPVVGSTYWQSTQYNPLWYPAGYTASLVVTNYGYTQLLYNRTPQPYKVSNSDLFANTVVDNPALLHYLSLFGYHLDMTKTEYVTYLNGNNPDTVSGTSLDFLGQQLGFTTDYISSPQLRRQRVKNASINYRLKGTVLGIHNAIAAITDWDSIITDSQNMLQDGDQAAFGHPQYDLWNPATTYFINQLIQFNGYNYKNLVQSYGQAQQPSGTNTSNTWWQVQISTTTTALINTTSLKNPANYTTSGPFGGTGGYSTWFQSAPYTPASTVQNGVATGLPHPTNASIQNWNALVYTYTNPGVNVDIANSIYGVINFPAWTNSTNYVPNNWVTTSSGNFYWKALRPSGPGTAYGFITPGTNDTFWKGEPGPGSKDNLIPDGVPLLQYRQWDSASTYQIGTQIQYFGIIYQAINVNNNSKPSGYYYSNQNWIYIQPAENIYTASAYQARLTTDTSTHAAFVDVFPYDSTNINQNTFQEAETAFLARFDGDYSNLNGINDNTLAYLGRPWTANPPTAKLWRSSFGMASVDQSLFGTTTYVTLTVADGRSDINLGLTFVTDYTDNLHVGHGIVFRYQDASNFWYATRKTLYKVVAGTESVVATWTRLIDGDRMLITLSGSSIILEKYVRDGTGGTNAIAIVTDTTFQTATIHGIMQKYSASGAV